MSLNNSSSLSGSEFTSFIDSLEPVALANPEKLFCTDQVIPFSKVT